MDNRHLTMVSFKVRSDRDIPHFLKEAHTYPKLSVKLMMSMMTDDLSSGGLNSSPDIEAS